MTARAANRGPAHPGLVLATCMLASSLSFVDGSVVNVSLPFIGRALGRSPAALQWVVDAYLLPLSALILLGGAAGDRFGRGRLLRIGVALFAVSSVACTVAPGYPTLLAARAAQGVGAAILLPNSLATLAATFQGEARGRAIGAWSALGAASAAAGPVLGGWLNDRFGWRAIFLISVPVALAAFALAWRYVRDAEDADGGRPRPFDTPGGLLATVALGAVAWGLTEGAGPGGWGVRALVLLATGAAAFAGFLAVEGARGEDAMTPLSLFASRPFVGLTVLTFLVYGALGGLLVALPFTLVHQFGFNGLQAGLALLPFPLVMVCASPFIGALAGRIGSKLPLTAGAVLLTLGLALMLRIGGPHARYLAAVLPALLTIALGVACTAAPLTNAVLGSVDGAHAGTASGLNSAVARAGGLIATALLGGVLAAGRGPALMGAFHLAATVGAAACLLGAACAALLLEGGPNRPPETASTGAGKKAAAGAG